MQYLEDTDVEEILSELSIPSHNVLKLLTIEENGFKVMDKSYEIEFSLVRPFRESHEFEIHSDVVWKESSYGCNVSHLASQLRVVGFLRNIGDNCVEVSLSLKCYYTSHELPCYDLAELELSKDSHGWGVIETVTAELNDISF